MKAKLDLVSVTTWAKHLLEGDALKTEPGEQLHFVGVGIEHLGKVELRYTSSKRYNSRTFDKVHSVFYTVNSVQTALVVFTNQKKDPKLVGRVEAAYDWKLELTKLQKLSTYEILVFQLEFICDWLCDSPDEATNECALLYELVTDRYSFTDITIQALYDYISNYLSGWESNVQKQLQYPDPFYMPVVKEVGIEEDLFLDWGVKHRIVTSKNLEYLQPKTNS